MFTCSFAECRVFYLVLESDTVTNDFSQLLLKSGDCRFLESRILNHTYRNVLQILLNDLELMYLSNEVLG